MTYKPDLIENEPVSIADAPVDRRSRIGRLAGWVEPDGTIVIPRADDTGFDCSLVSDGERTTGDFGGLVQEFVDLDEGLNWAERVHLEDYRLRIDYAGNQPCQWTLEKILPTGGFVEVFAAGNPVLMAWLRRKSVRYFKNIGHARRAETIRLTLEPTAD